MLRRPTRNCLLLLVSSAAITLSGCATTSGARNPQDPLESLNRPIYKFNDAVDKAVFKPVAQGYKKVVPEFVRTRVTHFFSNIDDIKVIANDLFQAKFRQAGEDLGRVIINTTAGVVGLVDVASIWGSPKHNEDFGQTLGYWGARPGPYLVLPFLGPSTVRDASGRFVVDANFGYWPYIDNMRARNITYAIDSVNARANLLDTEKILDEAALDAYAFLRDAYLQRRERLVYDGNPPKKNLDEDFEDEEAPLESPPPPSKPKSP